ncbi:hypothetical protein [Pararobbsia alpina]|uniref:hypothetical protein n=1 Tax=Pararobbsia alpina TaxID=621374 RepID=UPI001583C277
MRRAAVLLAKHVLSVLAGACVVAANAGPVGAQQAATGPAQKPGASASPRVSPYTPVKVPQHAKSYYQAMRGIEGLSVRRTASGNLLRFSYRVTDPEVAKLLGDKNTMPYLYGQANHVVLEVPVMENIGQLRQTGTLQTGQEYWMVFSNKGDLIKAGDRVNVMIGAFHIDGLVVE